MDPMQYLDPFLGGDLLANSLNLMTAAVGGQGWLGMGIGGLIYLGFWLAGKQELATPTVVTILLAAVVVPMLPGGLQGTAKGLVIVGVMGGLMAIGRRYIMSPGAT